MNDDRRWTRRVDPDKALNALREAIAEWTAAPRGTSSESESAQRAADLADDLDTYLTAGGVLPREWRASLIPTLAAMAEAGEVATVPIKPEGT